MACLLSILHHLGKTKGTFSKFLSLPFMLLPSCKLQVTKCLICGKDGGEGALALASEPEEREVPDQFVINTYLHISHKAPIY